MIEEYLLMEIKEKKIGVTPLMKQYYSVKGKHRDSILLFRMGDFFETFDEDAKEVSKILDITLTKRSNGPASAVPLAGIPHHSLNNYLPKLLQLIHYSSKTYRNINEHRTIKIPSEITKN